MKNNVKRLIRVKDSLIKILRIIIAITIISPIAFVVNLFRGGSLKEHFDGLSFYIHMIISGEDES